MDPLLVYRMILCLFKKKTTTKNDITKSSFFNLCTGYDAKRDDKVRKICQGMAEALHQVHLPVLVRLHDRVLLLRLLQARMRAHLRGRLLSLPRLARPLPPAGSQ